MHDNLSIYPSKTLVNEQIPDNCIENLTVDNLIFTLDEGQLKVLLVQYEAGITGDKWGLIGQWVKRNEDLETAAARVIKQVTGTQDLYLEQLRTFGNIDRFPNKRIVTVAHYALVRYEDTQIETQDSSHHCRWFNVRELPEMMFDHREILHCGLEYLQYKVRHEPIGFNLLPEKFTLLQLLEIYEAIFGRKLDKPNFRRKILKMNLLIDCNEKQQNVSHRAASLYRFDPHVYDKLKQFGFTFEF